MHWWERTPAVARRPWVLLLGPLALLVAALALRGTARPDPADPFRPYRALELTPSRSINCSGVVRGDVTAIQEAQLNNLEVANRKASLTPSDYLNMTRDCRAFKESRRYIEFPLSQEEKEFPIAYSMVIHHKIDMFERLLRSVYAPQNVYCIHMDSKSPPAFQEAVRAIAACFPNVFVASRLESVVYAAWSRLQADFNCMQDLLQSPVPWRYLINTCGTDFPIKTNAEIVRALQLLRGHNSVESEKPTAAKQQRWQYHYEVKESISRTNQKKQPPPHGYPMFTGSAYNAVTRDFVRYILENPTAQKFHEWSKDSYSPDEHVWATLNRMPGAPGGTPHNDKYQLTDMNALPRLVKWQFLEGDISKGAPYPPCTGRHQRAVCIYGVGDVPWMLQQHHLLANKFDPDMDDAAVQCLEEYLRHKALYGRGL
ncbi:GCNT3 acetylglucosaminyltransferase, partial [Drymodes brunneopygia]|nr:GCNT3 acetylglucosaminyltransferase [Drymodes brunneopygia]